jgi:hypothetical protein
MAATTVTVRIIGDASSAETAFKTAESAAGGLESSLGKVATTAAGFALGGAISEAPGYLLDAAKAAADDEANMSKLQTAITNVSGAYAPYNAAVQQAITDGQNKAFSDDETRNALTTLVNETGSTEEALKRLSVAQDLARGTGMDLETASKLVGKVTDDNTKVLARYGITVKDGATAQDLLNAVDGKFHGQAATFAQTDAAKMQIMADRVSELQEQLGYMLLPILTVVVGAGLRLADVIATRVVPAFATFIAGLRPIAEFIGGHLGPIIAGLAGVFVALVAVAVPAIVAWTIATWASVAAHLAAAVAWLAAYAPIIAIVIAVGVAVALLYEAWTSNFLGIRTITMSVIGWMQANVLPVLEAIFSGIVIALGIARDLFVAAWPVMQEAVSVAWTLIGGYITSLTGVIQTIAAVVGGTVAIVSDLIHGDFSGAWDDAKTAVQGVYDGISTILSGLPAMVLGFFTDMATQALGALAQLAIDAGTAATDVGTAVMSGIGDGITAAWHFLTDKLDAIISAVNGVIDRIDGAIGSINSALAFTIPGISLDTHIPGVGTLNAGPWNIDPPDIPSIPHLAGGGIAMRPTLAMIGERGPEAVIPLSRHAGGIGMLSRQEIIDALREGGRLAARELLTGTL